jgi:hypothetical protein
MVLERHSRRIGWLGKAVLRHCVDNGVLGFSLLFPGLLSKLFLNFFCEMLDTCAFIPYLYIN